MFAALDKENLVHGHQTAAASKPLNQTVKHLPPKTPGNKVLKTPFKIPLNDENGPPRFGKLGLEANSRGNENPTTGEGKGGFLQKNTFITPLGMYLIVSNTNFGILICTRPTESSPAWTKNYECKDKGFSYTSSSASQRGQERRAKERGNCESKTNYFSCANDQSRCSRRQSCPSGS